MDLSEFNIPTKSFPEFLSGYLGINLQPDTNSIQKSYDLADQILNEQPEIGPPEYVLQPGNLPHISLYIGPLKNVPSSFIQEIRDELAPKLKGIMISLGDLVGFHGGYIFWCMEKRDPSWEIVSSAHQRALEVTKHLDKEEAEKLALRPEVEANARYVKNLRTYGYTLSNDEYLPHITLGFCKKRAGLITGRKEPYVMQVDEVRVAQMGAQGRVDWVYV